MSLMLDLVWAARCKHALCHCVHVTFLGCYVDSDMELDETLCGRGHLRQPA